ncbi:5-hydroxyisourate hydrolase [Mycena sanguinolenta]|uniref:5-hydroxyisourate hydrolase n=1 Tax=Mycena sanguinolenta TaxID=230812 RepID=A0A8H7CKB1_9AGAR|nr:5-hydroxyisourate hydrolase [Mycena sanguinolenta]
MSKSPITCHVLDSSTGKPAEGVQIRLQDFTPAEHEGGVDSFNPLAFGTTNADGRCLDLLPPRNSSDAEKLNAALAPGTYKIVFKTKEYFEKTGRKCFYPWITFEIENPTEHYHIPLLISPYSFTTYRGS